ncbi:hypothetical protein V8C34DRAFT_327895 [Trichoderma compactum]
MRPSSPSETLSGPELESLIDVLENLKSVVVTDEGPMISVLEAPSVELSPNMPGLSRLGSQVRYMGGDIRDFKDMLAGYKSTIAIALGSLNMQNVQVTREALDGYHEMIRDTTVDLQAHLKDIDDKLASLMSQPQHDPDPAADESIRRMEEEKESTRQCILICESAKSHLQGLQDGFRPLGAQPDGSRAKTAVALSDARDRMVFMIAHLQARLVALSEQSLGTKFGRRSGIPAKGTLIVSTVGDLLNVKNVRVDHYSTQWLGSMTDASLQQLSTDCATSYSPSPVKNEDDPAFGGKHGFGHKLQGKGLSIQQSSQSR